VTTAASETVPAGDVISQNPLSCTACATSGDAVDLVVSSGPAPIDVPNVTGLQQTTAESAIIAANLTVGTVTTQSPDTIEKSVDFEQTSSQHLTVDADPIATETFTISLWFKLESRPGIDQTLIWFGDQDVEDNYYRVQYDESADEIRVSRRNSGINHHTTTNFGGLSIGVWYNLIVANNATNDIDVWINNAGAGTSGINVTGLAANVDRFSVGGETDVSQADFFDGLIAEVAIWDIANMSSAERSQLSDGDAAYAIRQSNLIRYWRLRGVSDLTDIIGGVTLTAFGSPISDLDGPVIDHPAGDGVCDER
jgi:hypothetical protein